MMTILNYYHAKDEIKKLKFKVILFNYSKLNKMYQI